MYRKSKEDSGHQIPPITKISHWKNKSFHSHSIDMCNLETFIAFTQVNCEHFSPSPISPSPQQFSTVTQLFLNYLFALHLLLVILFLFRLYFILFSFTRDFCQFQYFVFKRVFNVILLHASQQFFTTPSVYSYINFHSRVHFSI